MRKPLSYLSGIILLLSLVSCGKSNKYYNPVPTVTVNRQINLDNPAYINLHTAGGFYYMDGEGVRGIVIVHGYDDNFYALDRACPHHPTDSCAMVTMEDNKFYLRCGHYENKTWIPCCDSKYNLDGGLVSGPSEYPLKAYRVVLTGSQLSITN